MVTSSIFAVKNITAAPVFESVAEALEEGACETLEDAKLFSTEKRTSFDPSAPECKNIIEPLASGKNFLAFFVIKGRIFVLQETIARANNLTPEQGDDPLHGFLRRRVLRRKERPIHVFIDPLAYGNTVAQGEVGSHLEGWHRGLVVDLRIPLWACNRGRGDVNGTEAPWGRTFRVLLAMRDAQRGK